MSEKLEARVARLEELLSNETAMSSVAFDLLIYVTRHLPNAEAAIADYMRHRERIAIAALNSRLDLDARAQQLQLAHEALLARLGIDPE